MKILCYADFHGHLFTDFAEVDEVTGNTRFTQQLHALTFMRQYCEDNGIPLVLFAGDMYHKRKAVDQTVKNLIRDEVKAFGEKGIWTYMIPGNHDQVDNTDFPQHSLHSFRELDKVLLMDRFEPEMFKKGRETVMVYPAPYSKNAQMVKDELTRFAEMAKSEFEGIPNILLGHMGISGAYVGKGNYAMADAFAVSDLHPDVFNFGVFGHFHKRQLLGGNPNFFYCGSPLQHSFNDEGEEKGFYVIDTKNNTAKFVSIPAPQFLTVRVRDTDEVKKIEEAFKGNFIRFQIDAEKVQELTEKLPEELKFRVEPQKSYVEERRVDVDFSMSTAQIITEYAKKFNADALEIGLEILREVEEGK